MGLEVRRRARAAGSLKGRDHRIEAIDQRGVTYDMDVAVGERVRLFNRVNASYGQNSRGYFGENGTVAEIVSISPSKGIKLRRQDGRVGAIAWDSLKDESTGRIKLAYGSALTIDARQGDTLTDHITILPAGTKSIDAFRIYPADTRNREDSVIVVSHGAEKQDVCGKRPFGDPWITSAGDAEMREAIMANMAGNLSRQVEKPLAVDFLDGAMLVFHGSVGAHRAAWHRSEIAYAQNRRPDLVTVFENKRKMTALVSLLEAIKASTITARFMDLLRDEAGGIPRRDAIMPPSDAQLEFAEHLRREGFELRGEPIMDGKWRHARVEGDNKLKPSGRYRGFLDERPSGQYIRSKMEDRAKQWTPDRPLQPPTPEERQRFAERQAARDAERKAAEIKAGKRAFAIWANAPAAREHAYLDRKGVGAHGLKLDDKGNLLVPMADTGSFLRNIQTIAPDGTKLYQKDARKTGLFATLGAVDPAGPLLIAEGFATAASLREATGPRNRRLRSWQPAAGCRSAAAEISSGAFGARRR